MRLHLPDDHPEGAAWNKIGNMYYWVPSTEGLIDTFVVWSKWDVQDQSIHQQNNKKTALQAK